jgi:hypothetical protein
VWVGRGDQSCTVTLLSAAADSVRSALRALLWRGPDPACVFAAEAHKSRKKTRNSFPPHVVDMDG